MEQKTPENWETACVICSEVITQPICIDCLEEEVIQWLKLNEPDFFSLVKGISEFLKNGGEEKRVSCILCSKKMNICAYCYKNEIYDLLIQNSLELAEEFRERFFDYEILAKEAS